MQLVGTTKMDDRFIPTRSINGLDTATILLAGVVSARFGIGTQRRKRQQKAAESTSQSTDERLRKRPGDVRVQFRLL